MKNQIGTHCTTITYDEEKTAVRYHQTNVVTFDAHEITLNSGGWRTATTKKRMNQASAQFNLGFCVRQTNFDWFVRLPNGQEVNFSDGMTFKRR